MPTQKTTRITYRAMTSIEGRRKEGQLHESGVIDAGPDVELSFDCVTRDLRLKGPKVNITIPHISSFRVEHVEIKLPYEARGRSAPRRSASS